jgi:hypothetical protein
VNDRGFLCWVRRIQMNHFAIGSSLRWWRCLWNGNLFHRKLCHKDRSQIGINAGTNHRVESWELVGSRYGYTRSVGGVLNHIQCLFWKFQSSIVDRVPNALPARSIKCRQDCLRIHPQLGPSYQGHGFIIFASRCLQRATLFGATLFLGVSTSWLW